MPLYRDPTLPRPRPSLIRDLFTIPAKATNHQLENQATAVLAWLMDRSPMVARAVVALFMAEEHVPAAAIGARTWISLPKPEGGAVFPDLSIDAVDGELQLLIEVKVASGFHEYLLDDGTTLSQPEFYRHAWSALPTDGEAKLRAVGTLTRPGGTTTPDPIALRARDVAWSEMADRLEGLLDGGELEADVSLVTRSFLHAIETLIDVKPPDASQYDAWYARQAMVVDHIAAQLAQQPYATKRAISGVEYRGHRVGLLDVNGERLNLRIYASPVGARLMVHGWPDAVIVGVERGTDGELEPDAAVAVAEVGFHRHRDIDGWWLHRDFWALERATAAPQSVVDEVLERLSATGLIAISRTS